MSQETELELRSLPENESMTAEDIEAQLRSIDDSCDDCPRLREKVRRVERVEVKSRGRRLGRFSGRGRTRRPAKARVGRLRDLDRLYIEEQVEVVI